MEAIPFALPFQKGGRPRVASKWGRGTWQLEKPVEVTSFSLPLLKAGLLGQRENQCGLIRA